MKPREFEIRFTWWEGKQEYNATMKGEPDLYPFLQAIIFSVTVEVMKRMPKGSKEFNFIADPVVRCENCNEWMREGLVNIKHDRALCEGCET